MRIMGIDPGSVVTGYGIIDVIDRELNCIKYGCVKSGRKEAFHLRLSHIFDEVQRVIEQYTPDHVVFEDIFYGRSVRSVIQLSHARSAAVLAAAKAGAQLSYYAPRVVKQALTGNGAASKEQVQYMVKAVLNLSAPVTPMDASDALAIAVCHAFRNQSGTE